VRRGAARRGHGKAERERGSHPEKKVTDIRPYTTTYLSNIITSASSDHRIS